MSITSAERKLEQRLVETARKPMGKRADLLIKDRNSKEYGYGEASKVSDVKCLKNMMDSKLKTIKTMKDMMRSLSNNTQLNEIKKIRTMGYQCSRKSNYPSMSFKRVAM